MGRVTDEADEAWAQVSHRSHPCRQLLDSCAAGYEALASDIAEVVDMARPGDRAAVRERLTNAAHDCRDLYAAGAHQQARVLAHDTAFELSATLGAHRPPTENLRGLSPRELAERIRR